MDLVVRPTALDPDKPWALQLRNNTGPETLYTTLCRVGHDTARRIIDAGAPTWLFGEPDWITIDQKERVRRAEQLEAEAAALREGLGGRGPGFQDAGGRHVTIGDRVAYPTTRGMEVGWVVDVLQDGDAQVKFDSGWRPHQGMVKWSRLIKVVATSGE